MTEFCPGCMSGKTCVYFYHGVGSREPVAAFIRCRCCGFISRLTDEALEEAKRLQPFDGRDVDVRCLSADQTREAIIDWLRNQNVPTEGRDIMVDQTWPVVVRIQDRP